MAIDIFVENNTLFLDYSPDFQSNWVPSELEISGEVTIKKVFTFKKADLYENELLHVGRQEGLMKVAKNMLTKQFSVEDVIQITELPLEVIQGLLEDH